MAKETNPEGVESVGGKRLIQPLQGWTFGADTQGSSCLATLGYMITTPSGLEEGTVARRAAATTDYYCASSMSLAMVFMLRAVPVLAPGIFSLESAMPPP